MIPSDAKVIRANVILFFVDTAPSFAALEASVVIVEAIAANLVSLSLSRFFR